MYEAVVQQLYYKIEKKNIELFLLPSWIISWSSQCWFFDVKEET